MIFSWFQSFEIKTYFFAIIGVKLTKLLFVSIKISRYEIFKILKVLSNQDYLVNFEDFEGACSPVLAVVEPLNYEKGEFLRTDIFL